MLTVLAMMAALAATTQPATEVTNTSATLNGTTDTAGIAITNSSRNLLWKWKAADPYYDSRTDTVILADLLLRMRKLYEEDEASRSLLGAQVADRRAQAGGCGERKGRPTKRERREMERWRDK